MKIHYITSHGMGEWTVFDPTDPAYLYLSFEPDCHGVLTLGTRSYEVKGGRAKIPLISLPNDEYHPKLEADTGVYVLEGFIKSAREITVLKTDEAVIRNLVVKYHRLEKLYEALKERVSKLEAMCQGHNIFNFERKE